MQVFLLRVLALLVSFLSAHAAAVQMLSGTAGFATAILTGVGISSLLYAEEATGAEPRPPS